MSSNQSFAHRMNISLERINRDLERLVIYDSALSPNSIITKSVLELIHSGGKRLRPIMVIIGSRFGSKPENSNVYKLAAACEFIHAASLIHDDILDQSDTRRGHPALHRKTDPRTAVFIGNYMMCRVVELLSKNEDQFEPYLDRLASATTTQLCIGEYQQMKHRFNYELTLEDYWAKTNNKTAMLMASCLEIGAFAAKADREVSDMLYQFGEHLGMAFQIRDDVLDYIQTSDTLGKPAGADLRSGQITLPAMLAMEDPAIKERITKLNADSSPEMFDEAIQLIRESGAIDRALEMSFDFMSRAWLISEQLSRYPAHQDLQTLWRYFDERKF